MSAKDRHSIGSEFDIRKYLKDHKIPFRNSERISILSKVLPYLEPFMEANTVCTLRELTFLSSRALAEIVRLGAQLAEVNETIARIDRFMKDTVDDEVKNIAISASKKTATEILQKFGFSNREDGDEDGDDEDEEGDDDESETSEEEEGEESEEED